METLTTRSEPKGKLDTMAAQPAAMLAAVAVVNGPEGEPLDWHAIDWRAAEEDVRRLRQRIFTASRVGDLKRVRSLQEWQRNTHKRSTSDRTGASRPIGR